MPDGQIFTSDEVTATMVAAGREHGFNMIEPVVKVEVRRTCSTVPYYEYIHLTSKAALDLSIALLRKYVQENKPKVFLPKPGQIWLDMDVRIPGRTIEIQKMENGVATCVSVNKGVARTVKIKAYRFVHGSDYKLVSETVEPKPVQA